MLVESAKKTFDQEAVPRGALIHARHRSWQEGQSGIVTESSPDILRVQYPPTIQNVLNHFFILASEVEAGEWEIRYSSDGMKTVKTYPERSENELKRIDTRETVAPSGGICKAGDVQRKAGDF